APRLLRATAECDVAAAGDSDLSGVHDEELGHRSARVLHVEPSQLPEAVDAIQRPGGFTGGMREVRPWHDRSVGLGRAGVGLSLEGPNFSARLVFEGFDLAGLAFLSAALPRLLIVEPLLLD